ncbi:MAG: hypothetical protein B7Z60_06890 [Ferrovum sp. 37-45-19]|jgi:hypothetical protein|uniref:Spy/CpxP family protein refolding chaperone n=1 Tax=Ferrovum sp. JA12 TaxID=1356299 RepID=UPI0007029669|nr:Spy/CpxP family protein refolding chaperone [Ferrovum sp. JA12]OYV78772.1 MAG: hypothetical protein B7Z65_08955 [Ferrovum sp. 21-44-67]OYV93922.1 MAG: hypothetical protein B7Z60_06890 [Ferrovum sp. 37-45-19]OZB32010.1 MAG: hypothetical protein B7X47_07770 [Ferrovum sp. 34-44-207]HQT81979.1 Spy/CpxP family protein refolding chaperone [Ferrovaceae bacterium]KRH78962.1 hypothetical protein FERRO_00230 [Ferrovum sp. JA12]
MKTWKFVLITTCVLLWNNASVYAQGTTEKDSPPDNYQQEFIASRLNDLHDKIQLSADQEQAWSTWSSGVKKDFSDMHKMMQDKMASMHHKHELMLTTPERLEAYQSYLNHRLEALQEHVNRVKQAADRTMSFYSVLDSKQKVIFDLYWSNWQANYFTHSYMGGYSHGDNTHSMMGSKVPMINH